MNLLMRSLGLVSWRSIAPPAEIGLKRANLLGREVILLKKINGTFDIRDFVVKNVSLKN